MDKIKTSEQLNQLYGFYYSLLTKTQQEYFVYYYQQNYTLQEIADLVGVSRNAIFDQLEKTKQRLLELEEKLQLLKKRKQLLMVISEVKQTNNLTLLDKLVEEGEDND